MTSPGGVPWPGVIEEMEALIEVLKAAAKDLTSDTGRSQGPKNGVVNGQSGLLEHDAVTP